MDILIQQNSSEKIALDKDIATIATISGSMRNESSIFNPVIRVAGDVSAVANANYMTINDFGRSYFITDIETIRNGIYDIHGHCDVLSSFKAAIRANVGIVKRQENTWNLYLDDGSLMVYNKPHINTFKFPSGFTGFGFIFAVAGSAQSNNGGGNE